MENFEIKLDTDILLKLEDISIKENKPSEEIVKELIESFCQR